MDIDTKKVEKTMASRDITVSGEPIKLKDGSRAVMTIDIEMLTRKFGTMPTKIMIRKVSRENNKFIPMAVFPKSVAERKEVKSGK